MPNRILDSPLSNWMGGGSVILSVWMKSMSWFSNINFSDTFLLLTSIASFLFVCMKIITLYTDWRIKKHNFSKQLEDEKDEE